MKNRKPTTGGGASPLSPTGPTLLSIWPRLLPAFDPTTQEASKCAAEMAMALHFVLCTYPAAMIDMDAVAAVEAALLDRMGTDACLRLVTNPFLLAQGLTPYIFLRSEARRSPFHDGLLADFIETDRALRECTPYRAIERTYLLYKLGRGPLPDWDAAPVMTDIRAAWAFNRDLSYAFTHQVFFCTDFGCVLRPDPMVKAAAMLLAAQTHGANDVDLFWECCICLMTQPLSAGERDGLLHLLAGFEVGVPDLIATGDIRERYHPLAVRDILRGLVLRRFDVDIADCGPGNGPGPFAALSDLALALPGKDAGAIVVALGRCPSLPGLRIMARDRLRYLGDLARHGILFEREFASLSRRDPALYTVYSAQVTQLLNDMVAHVGDEIAAGA